MKYEIKEELTDIEFTILNLTIELLRLMAHFLN